MTESAVISERLPDAGSISARFLPARIVVESSARGACTDPARVRIDCPVNEAKASACTVRVRDPVTVRRYVPEDLERYRVALATAIAHSSLRTVALAVGMSPTGLTKFLNGGEPYGKTIERLRNWYVREAGLHRMGADEIASLLRRVVATLPEPDVGVVNILEAVDRSYRSAGLRTPAWVSCVRGTLPRERADTHEPGEHP